MKKAPHKVEIYRRKMSHHVESNGTNSTLASDLALALREEEVGAHLSTKLKALKPPTYHTTARNESALL
jgi:hypothetical protein